MVLRRFLPRYSRPRGRRAGAGRAVAACPARLRARPLRDPLPPGRVPRCGPACADTWNRHMALVRGIPARAA